MGGSSGGGSSSGAVSYPAYMEAQHTTWLASVAAAMTTAQTGDNPYTAAVAYNPDTVLAASASVISLFSTEVVAAAPATDWDTYYDAAAAKYTPATITAITDYTFVDVFSAAALAATVTAYQTDLESRRDTDFLPAFKVGMLNIGAVVTSSFAVGTSLITADVARQVALFSANLNFQNEEKKLKYQEIQAAENTAHNVNIIKRDSVIVTQDLGDITFNASVAESLITKDLQVIDLYRALGNLTVDSNRIKIVSKQEENERTIKYDEQDSLWDLEVYQYGNNTLAAISGAAASTKGNEVSTGASVLGGVMSGAAAGSAIMPGIGTGIGAVLGGLAGLLQ